MKTLLLAIEARINALSPARRHALAFVALILSLGGLALIAANHIDVQVDSSQWMRQTPGGHKLGATVPFSSVTANGDLSGHYPGPTVAKVNGTTYPAGGALTTGTVPRVTGASTVAYGAVDLSNSSAVANTLSISNIPTGSSSSTVCIGNDSRLSDSRAPTGTASGDLSSTYPGPTVAKINGATVPAAGSLTTGNVLKVSGASATTYGALDPSVAASFSVGADVPWSSHKITGLANGSGAQDAAAFGQIAATTLNSFAAPTADVSLNSHKVTSLAVGTTSGDGVSYAQLGDGTIGYPAAITSTSHSHVRTRPERSIQIYDDFFIPSSSFLTSTVIYSLLGWVPVNNGTGAAPALVNSNNAVNIGEVSSGAGTTTDSGYSVILGYGNTGQGCIWQYASGDAFEWEWKGKTPVVSDGTNTFAVRFGVGNTLTGSDPTEGIWFQWDANSDTHILGKTATGSVTTTAVTSTVVAGTSYHLLKVTKAAGTTTIHFWIDGSDVGTGTCPTAANMGPFSGITKTKGSLSDVVTRDFFYIDYTFGSSR